VTTAGAPVFSEAPADRLRRWLLGLAWSLKNDGALGALRIGLAHLRALVTPDPGLPAPDAPPLSPNGAVAVARDLSVPTLREAYRRGLYPLAHVLSPKWMSPAQRTIVRVEDFHLSRRLRSHIRRGEWHITFDTAFAEVMKGCAEPRPGQTPLTWITPQIMRAFQALHEAGEAHSFEVWDAGGNLVGGGYGVASGGCFTIESQFFRADNASKVGFAFLAWHLADRGFSIVDNKTLSEGVARFGFAPVPRREFLALLSSHAGEAPERGPWTVEAEAAEVADWHPEDERAA